MLAYVPVVFELYRPLAPRLRWTLQCLVGFADRAGRCWPSVRKLAEVTGVGKSSVSRHLAALVRAGVVSRSRKPGGVYTYRIDSRFLPAARARAAGITQPAAPAPPVSRQRAAGVPHGSDHKEYPIKKSSDSALPDDRSQWQARLRSWEKSRFWLPQWGDKPGEPSSLAPGIIEATPHSL